MTFFTGIEIFSLRLKFLVLSCKISSFSSDDEKSLRKEVLMRPTPSERDFGFRFSRTDKTLKSLTSNQNQGGLLNFMVDS